MSWPVDDATRQCGTLSGRWATSRRSQVSAGHHRRLKATNRCRQTGSVAIETVLIVPALLLFVILTIALARWATAYADLQSGALAGARAAALAADSTEGAQLAERISRQQMVSGGPNCQTLTVTTSTAALDQDPGQLGEVSVSLVCLLPLGDLTLPGLPGQVTIEAAADCPIDPFVPR